MRMIVQLSEKEKDRRGGRKRESAIAIALFDCAIMFTLYRPVVYIQQCYTAVCMTNKFKKIPGSTSVNLPGDGCRRLAAVVGGPITGGNFRHF